MNNIGRYKESNVKISLDIIELCCIRTQIDPGHGTVVFQSCLRGYHKWSDQVIARYPLPQGLTNWDIGIHLHNPGLRASANNQLGTVL